MSTSSSLRPQTKSSQLKRHVVENNQNLGWQNLVDQSAITQYKKASHNGDRECQRLMFANTLVTDEIQYSRKK